MSAYTDLTIDQGASFELTFDLVGDDGYPINITGYVFSGQIRKTYYSTNPTANIIVTILNPVAGNTLLSISSSNTANIVAGRYVYDIKMKDTVNVTSRVVEGIVTVTPQVTR
jgi:hypothetical protein